MLTMVQAILGIEFIYLSICSIFNLRSTDKKFNDLNVQVWFRYVTGLTQLIGGLSLIIGLKEVIIGFFGAIWLSIMLAVGIALRIKVKHKFTSLIPAIVILLSLYLIAIKNLIKIF